VLAVKLFATEFIASFNSIHSWLAVRSSRNRCNISYFKGKLYSIRGFKLIISNRSCSVDPIVLASWIGSTESNFIPTISRATLRPIVALASERVLFLKSSSLNLLYHLTLLDVFTATSPYGFNVVLSFADCQIGFRSSTSVYSFDWNSSPRSNRFLSFLVVEYLLQISTLDCCVVGLESVVVVGFGFGLLL